MDELALRQPPYSLDAERSVIGSMLIDSRCVSDIVGILKPEDFYLQENRDIFTTIYSMFSYSMNIDPVTVMEQMKQSGLYDEEKTRDYLLQVLDVTPTAANAKQYAQIVADKSLLRQIANAATDISQIVSEKMVAFIGEHLGNVSLDSIGKHFFYNSTYVSNLLKSGTGRTFSEILLRLRMERAVMLMKGTTLSNEEIADMLGYSNTSNFYKAFRQYFGISPLEYLHIMA